MKWYMILLTIKFHKIDINFRTANNVYLKLYKVTYYAYLTIVIPKLEDRFGPDLHRFSLTKIMHPTLNISDKHISV